MRIDEFDDKFDKNYQDLDSDQSQITLNDTRKTKLTLRKINKLRRISDIRKIEHALEMKFVQQMYGPSESGSSDFGF